jgi:uncharacterized protein (TIGR03086 family)
MTESANSAWPILAASLEMLREAGAGVAAGHLGDPTPCSEWTVTQVLQHAAGDQLAWAAAVGYGPGPEENPFDPSGKLPGSVADLLGHAIQVATRAWAGVDASAPAVSTPLPQGDLPPDAAVSACALDAAIHGWDVAVATGQAAPLTAELAAQLMPVARAIVEPLRQYGAYATALPPEPDDDGKAQLLRYLGRNPGWTR